MKKLGKYFGVPLSILLIIIWTCSTFFSFSPDSINPKKIGGVNFVSPAKKSDFSNFTSLGRINAKWVAFNPYAFSYMNKPFVQFNNSQSWWGENSSGIQFMLKQAKKENLKIMLKPHVWVIGQGWCGDYDLETDSDWKTWEMDYKKYILNYAKIAEENKVDMLCIGTEYKIAATKRINFWRQLIKDIRSIYKGKLIYAANWDNFENITFWDQLDYIGIDAYFPLSETKDANKNELDNQWTTIRQQLKQFSQKNNKKIIFTEYGYKSVHKAAWKQWEIEKIKPNMSINMQAQKNAYSSLFENVWKEPWFMGGFLWKWYAHDESSGGINNSDYTPQHKPVEKIIRHYY